MFKRIARMLGGKETTLKHAKEAFEKGRQQYENGEFEQAIACFSEAVELDPQMAKAYRNRGLSHMAMNDNAKALVDLSAALRLDDKDARAYWNRAVIYRKAGEDRKADADFKMAKKLDPRLASEA